MTLVVIAILLLLTMLIVAGPLLENIIDRIWPPRPPQMTSGRTEYRRVSRENRPSASERP